MPCTVPKVVFPVAGLGTRFLPATKSQPKEMLPLVDKPIIQYGVEEALASGVDNIVMVTGRGKVAIEDHFDVSFELERTLKARGKTHELELVHHISDLISISYVRQKEARGLGHAIAVTRELVGNDPFAVVLADDVIHSKTPALKQLLDVYAKTQAAVIAVMKVPKDRITSYGMVEIDPAGDDVSESRLYRIKNLVEKPAADYTSSRLAIVGRYVFPPEIFASLDSTKVDSGGELQLTDAVNKLIETQPVYAYHLEGERYDTGDKLGFLKATVEFALRRKDLGDTFRNYLKELDL